MEIENQDVEFARALATIDKVNESLYIYRSILVCKSDDAVTHMINALSEKEYPCGDSLEYEGVRMLVQTFIGVKDNIDRGAINLDEISVIYIMDIGAISPLLDLIGSRSERMIIVV
jgi:hypothetical protein